MSKNGGYYFGEETRIEAQCDEENEWEGTFLDTSILAQLAEYHLEPFWVEVWARMATYLPLTFRTITHRTTYDEYCRKEALIDWKDDTPATLQITEANEIQAQPIIWTCNTTEANKKGWDWHGDTDVYVRQFTARNLTEACIKALLTLAPKIGEFELDMCKLVHPHSWAEFWEIAIGLTNDLPKNGPAPIDVACLYRSGNEKVYIACLDTSDIGGKRLYYHVEFYTS
eukprot:Phypoly_transcript_13272.p1 GENE.Phypoly_transcript_13272~~Phypoly_transcript_13272.p1  ORF type:complete len:227 (+),score=30.39 Phypoly_transcript_13272:130-810(+)